MQKRETPDSRTPELEVVRNERLFVCLTIESL